MKKLAKAVSYMLVLGLLSAALSVSAVVAKYEYDRYVTLTGTVSSALQAATGHYVVALRTETGTKFIVITDDTNVDKEVYIKLRTSALAGEKIQVSGRRDGDGTILAQTVEKL